jgi:hypothetical protein
MIIRFDHRIEVAAPSDFAAAVRKAAAARQMTIADFARDALSREVKRAGVAHVRLPPISSPNAKVR